MDDTHQQGRRGRDAGDEPLRGLAAPGPSKVGTVKAMRARDVSRSDSTRQGSGHTDGGAGRSGSSPVDS